MKPSTLHDVLVTAFAARQNILITGAPGIGKSDVTYQASVASKGDLLISHPVCSDPADFKGYPFPVENNHADFLPFGDLLRLMNATGLTIMFFDDLGQARPATQASIMQLILGFALDKDINSDTM